MSHSHKICSRCGHGFSCQSDSPLACWCKSLYLQQVIPTYYEDCLCPQCLDLFTKPPRQSLKAGELREGHDFYFQRGLMVLTAEYLLRQGKCCGSGCRHCPY